jgi:hypothetical protein
MAWIDDLPDQAHASDVWRGPIIPKRHIITDPNLMRHG